jgi:hypothetical protein
MMGKAKKLRRRAKGVRNIRVILTDFQGKVKFL